MQADAHTTPKSSGTATLQRSKNGTHQDERLIRGIVLWDDTGEPVDGAKVLLHTLEEMAPLAEVETDRQGAFVARENLGPIGKDGGRTLALYVDVYDADGQLLATTRETPVRVAGANGELQVAVSGARRRHERREPERPKIQVGPMLLDAQAVEKAEPAIVLEIARALVQRDASKASLERIATLSENLVPARTVDRTLCGTAILETIDALIRHKHWPRELALEVDDILTMRDHGFVEATYDCPNFHITYQTDGPAAVNPDTSAQNVLDPGTSTVLASLPSGGPPTYIKRVCFWLERALNTYVSPPFSLLNPAGGGKIPVYITSDPYGSAGASAFYLNNALAPDLLCAVAVHELFHMVQYQYGGAGTWRYSVFEGGAVWAEDTNAEMMNRYLYEAGSPTWSGVGVLVEPHRSIETAGYDCGLFWRYVAEQQSALIGPGDEPKIGVDVYRQVIEKCSAGTYSSDNVKEALRSLPWYQDFYEFGYSDPARLDLTSSETTFGNYVLACYLKDLGVAVPDRRFDFMEDDETIFFDEAVGLPAMTTMPSVTLAGSGTVAPGSSASFTNSVPRFGSRYYEVAIDPAVTSVEVQFAASGGLTSSIFHIVLIDQDNAVRDVYRTDYASYTKRFANLLGGKNLSKVVLVASGAASSGNFSISVNPATAAPNVMVTRWHSPMKAEIEIDSRNWAWTWVSPDIWVDNDGDGIADGQVFFDFNNKLYIRLHNKGNAPASGIGVQFFYQDASGALPPGSWLPVQNTGGITQSLAGLSLPAEASNQWSVDWSPAPSGASQHFCVRAIVTVPGDPNTDNKRVLSNFGNVIVKPGGFFDIRLLRRNIHERLRREITLAVVPRLTPDFELSPRDLREQRSILLDPGEVARDAIRILHRPVKERILHVDHEERNGHHECTPPLFRNLLEPDPRGHYEVDPRTLPPGVAGRAMVTIVHLADGLPQGGVTVMITPDDGKRSTRPKRRGGKTARQPSKRAKRAR